MVFQYATSSLAGDGMQAVGWTSALLSTFFTLRFLYACWKGGDLGQSKGLFVGLAIITMVLAYFAHGEATRMYAESNGFKTGDIYLMFFTMMPGSLLLVGPFVLLFSSSRKDTD